MAFFVALLIVFIAEKGDIDSLAEKYGGPFQVFVAGGVLLYCACLVHLLIRENGEENRIDKVSDQYATAIRGAFRTVIIPGVVIASLLLLGTLCYLHFFQAGR